MVSVLFVCTANICRSPMAAKLFKKISALEEDDIEWEVDSAGTWTVDNMPAAEMAVTVLKEMGLDLSKHRSTDVARLDLQNYDLILTMERGHKESLVVEFPQSSDRIHMLTEMVSSSFDIPDPIGGTIQDFKETVALLENLLIRGYSNIKRISIKDT